MTERTYWEVDVEVDDLADELLSWFRRGGFQTQDFVEGQAIVLQARKTSWLRAISGLNLALTVRLVPLEEGLRVEVGAGEWIDKAVGGALGVLVAWPLAVTTGIGLVQQSQLPQQVLDFIEGYVYARRRPRRGPRREVSRWEEEWPAEELDEEEESPFASAWEELAAFDAALREARKEAGKEEPKEREEE
ncbi:MAG TPA: hypothetical protein EYP85_02480 [Armatimonadetes bacterium]|nr:hypothetical protein [Armatimonadota bacterium]